MAFLNGDTIELFGDPFTNDNFPQESDTPFRVCKNDDGTMTWMPGILL